MKLYLFPVSLVIEIKWYLPYICLKIKYSYFTYWPINI